MTTIYEQIDAALREVERTRRRQPILDLLAQAWDEGHSRHEAQCVQQYDVRAPCQNPYRG